MAESLLGGLVPNVRPKAVVSPEGSRTTTRRISDGLFAFRGGMTGLVASPNLGGIECVILHKIKIANSVVEGQATKSVQLLEERVESDRANRCKVMSKARAFCTVPKKKRQSMSAEATPKVLVVSPEGRTTKRVD